MSTTVAAVISLSGSGVSPYRQEAYRVEAMLRHASVAEDQIAEAMASSTTGRPDCAAATTSRRSWPSSSPTATPPWYPALGDDGVVEHLAFMAHIYGYDPVPALERVTCPPLAIWGQRDIYERGPRIPD